MAIRLTKTDKERIKKTNQFIRNKKNRLLKNYGVNVAIQPIDLNKITTRDELNNFYDKARRFKNSNRYKYVKNKYGFVMDRYSVNMMKYQVSNINSMRKREWNKVKRADYTDRGKKIGTLSDRRFMEPNRYGSYNMLSFNFDSFKSLKQWNDRREHLKTVSRGSYYRSKNEQLKENILQAIATHWGVEGYDAYKFIDSMSADDVVREFESESIFSMDVFGSPDVFSREQIKINMNEFYKTYGLQRSFLKTQSGIGKKLNV